MPELYINETQITDNDYGIEYMPCVNNNGVVAYAYYEESCMSSSVIVDGATIHKSNACKTLYLDDESLYFSDIDLENEYGILWKYNLNARNKVKIAELSQTYIEKLVPLTKNSFLIETWAAEDNSRRVKKITKEGEVSEILDTDSESIIAYENDKYYIDYIEGNCNAMYLFNALNQYYNSQYGEPFSLANDYAGRISWNESYRLSGMLELYHKTENREIREEISKTCKNLFDVTNEKLGVEGEEVCPSLWATKKYSVDKRTPRTDLVDTSCILYPLLVGANRDIFDKRDSDKIIALAEKSYQYFDDCYDNGHYKIERGSNFAFDGVDVPWNQQNMFGLVLIELYKATGDNKYYERCKELMSEFKSEWIYLEDRVIWNYWPNMFYEGWDASDEISINTPSMEAIEGNKAEDSSHSGINAKFVKEYFETFDDGVVIRQDILKIRNTLQIICSDKGFLDYIDTETIKFSYANLISSWWVEYDNIDFNNSLTQIGPGIYPDFDAQRIYAYAYNYDPEKPINLEIDRYAVEDLLIKEKSFECRSQEDVFEYF